MHPWHRRDVTRWMREQAQAMTEAADRMEKRPPDKLEWGVGWGPSCVSVTLDERKLSESEVENLVAGGIWAMFESVRDAGDPRDAKAFERVMRRVEELSRERCRQPAVRRV